MGVISADECGIAEATDSEMFTCDFDSFLAEYGPAPVSPEDIAACRQSLASSAPDTTVQVERWPAYSCAAIGGKDIVLAHMEAVQRAVCDWARANGRNKNEYVFELRWKHNNDPSTDCRMDACFVEHEYESTGRTAIVVFPIAVKTLREGKKVRERIVADCYRILSEDPHRMFIFALTLERDRASLWYFSRMHSMKARSFDWAGEDLDKLIAVFLSVAYATPEQLGLDPCVDRSALDGEQYIYEFQRHKSDETGTATMRHTAIRVTKSVDNSPNIFQTSPASICPSNYRRDTSGLKRMKKVRVKRTQAPTQQHRFVHEEVCLELYRLPTVGDVMEVLSQAADALLSMFCAGWLHRDISLGNILALRTSEGYRVKLTGLEFAQKMDDEARDESRPRTGTPFFMAFEIMAGQYLIHMQAMVDDIKVSGSLASMFALPSDHPHYDVLSRTSGIHPALLDLTEPPKYVDFEQTPPREGVVRPNYQHDLESLWWIVLFVVTSLVGHLPSRSYAAKIFQHQLKPLAERATAFSYNIRPSLKRILKADLRDVFAPFLEKLRSKMNARAIIMEVFGQHRMHEEYTEIHEFFSTAFRDLKNNSDSCWRAVAITENSDAKNVKIGVGQGSIRGQETALDNKRRRQDNDEGLSSRPHKVPRVSQRQTNPEI